MLKYSKDMKSTKLCDSNLIYCNKLNYHDTLNQTVRGNEL